MLAYLVLVFWNSSTIWLVFDVMVSQLVCWLGPITCCWGLSSCDTWVSGGGEGAVGLTLHFPVYLWLLVQQVAACRLSCVWWVWICLGDVLVVCFVRVKWRFRFVWTALRDLVFSLFCTKVFIKISPFFRLVYTHFEHKKSLCAQQTEQNRTVSPT